MMWHALALSWLANLSKCTSPKKQRSDKKAVRRRPLLSCEPLEDRCLLSVTAQEQLFIYLLNRARHDPVAYQQEQNLSVDLSGVAARPPLAVNDKLFDSTEFHATDMANRDYFDHNTPEGLTPNEMVTNAGYTLNATFFSLPAGNNVESIAAGNAIDTAIEALNLLIVDAGVNPPGHRIQLLATDSSGFFARHREIGVGHALNLSSQFDNYWAIHTAFTNTTDKFLTGVVFNDVNSNGRYDLNEGLSGVTVDLGGGTSTLTNAAGGWSIPVSGTPSVTLTVSGGAFVGSSTTTLTVGSDNIEIDFISGDPMGIVNFGANHAPVLANLTFKLPTIAEDANPAGTLISTLVGAAISDVDPVALEGIAVTAATGVGSWQFSSDGGVNWTDFGTVSAAQALLLPDNYMVRFLPGLDASGTGSFTFRAWDQHTGAAEDKVDLSFANSVGGTKAYSTASRTATITITKVNDAPVLDNTGSPALPNTKEDVRSVSVTVLSLLGSSVTDVDVGALKGIAVVGVSTGGTWQYSIDAGVTFKNFGTLSESAARLLRAGDRIRFVPAHNFNGTATFTFRAWDRTKGVAGSLFNITTTGTGGTTAFSLDQETASITVTPVNDAPVLAIGTPVAPAVAVNDANPTGVTVDALAGGFITDVDAGAVEGIAVIGATGAANGQWQFSSDGTSWTSFGTVTSKQARLLSPTDMVRFLPNPGYTLITAASVQPALIYRAWDQTTGAAGQVVNIPAVGGITAFSTRAHVARGRVNDAPTLTSAAPVIGPTTANKSFLITVATLLGNSVQDVGNLTRQGIAVTGLSAAGTGRWQYSTDGGVTFKNFVNVSDATALTLRSTDRLRYVPFGSVGAATITYRAWDQTTGLTGRTTDLSQASSFGGRTAFSSASDTATLNVS